MHKSTGVCCWSQRAASHLAVIHLNIQFLQHFAVPAALVSPRRLCSSCARMRMRYASFLRRHCRTPWHAFCIPGTAHLPLALIACRAPHPHSALMHTAHYEELSTAHLPQPLRGCLKRATRCVPQRILKTSRKGALCISQAWAALFVHCGMPDLVVDTAACRNARP